MEKLIRESDAIKVVRHTVFESIDADTRQKLIESIPAVEPKQGEWIYCEDDEGQDGYRCSECGFFVPWYYGYEDINFIHRYNACPSCMARMKGTDDE